MRRPRTTDALVLLLKATDAWRKKTDKRCLRALKTGSERWHQRLEARSAEEDADGGEENKTNEEEKEEGTAEEQGGVYDVKQLNLEDCVELFFLATTRNISSPLYEGGSRPVVASSIPWSVVGVRHATFDVTW